MPPLPPVPNVVRLTTQGFVASQPWIFRTFWQYAGGTPSAGGLATLATSMHNALAPHLNTGWSSDTTATSSTLVDLASASGALGTGGASLVGQRPTVAAAALNAFHIKFQIARRYRGGHPGIYTPPAGDTDSPGGVNWSSSLVSGMTTGMSAWAAICLGLTSGTINLVNQVNVSYYQGFTVVTDSHGRSHNVPKLRTSPLVDIITGYACEATISTQRRRGNR